MPRKATDTDKKLLLEGRKILIKKGASKLRVREVADAAKVNLGMFNYYFGNKETFIEKILSEVYETFLSELHLTENDPDLAILESQLLLMAKFSRDNRHLILVLLNDILNEEKSVQKFARLKMKKHFVILSKTIKGCQKKNLLVDAPLPFILTQLAGGIGFPNLIPEILKNIGINKVSGLPLNIVSKKLMTDEALEMRVKILIKGLKKD